MKTYPPLAEISDVLVIDRSRAAGEPDWLTKQRVEAWQFFASSEPPHWRRTDLSKFKPEEVLVAADTSATSLYQEEDLTDQGVIFTTLAQAIHAHGDLIRRYLGTAIEPTRHKFLALNAALWQDGVFLYVPKHTNVELPLTAMFSMPVPGGAIVPRNLVILDDGASVTFVEEYHSVAASDQALAAPVTEMFLGNDATLRFVAVQTWGEDVYHIGAQKVCAGRGASVEWAAVHLGARVQHIEAETALEGDGSRVEWVAATFAADHQNLLTAPWLRHIGAKTEAHMDFKTVVKDQSYTTFDGMIKIEHQSRATVSRLEEHALHLSPKARSDSIPGLMIDTNDVARAGHASTSGEVDEEQLFYMRSRGIPRDEAIHLIVMGFFEPVLDHIPNDALRQRIAEMIEAKI
ncbi:MAG: Fe-S cluster assembly protein SufD [Roseiflexus sp.]